jgi:hypothetical protein
MSGRTVRCRKLAVTMARIGSRIPARPIRVRTLEHATTAAERAARIAADDAARKALHAVPHSQLGAIGTIMRFRKNVALPLTDFGDDEP